MKNETPLLSELLREVSIALGLIQPSIIFHSLTIEGVTIRGNLMGITIKDNQKFTLKAQGVSAKGNPTALDGPITFESNDPNLTVNLIGENEVEVIPVGPVGNFQVKGTGDAKVGEGEDMKLGLFDVEVVAGEAVNITFIPGPVTDQ